MATSNKSSGNSRADKAAAARALADSLRADQEAKAKRNRIIFSGVIGAVVLAVIVIIVVLVLSSQGAATQAVQDVADKPTQNVSADGTIAISKNGVGESKAIKGKPTLDIYNDFICPSCAGFENTFGDAISDLVNDGNLNVRYHPLGWFNNTSPQYDGNKATGKSFGYSIRAAAAAYYIAEKAPDDYIEFMKVMYTPGNQPEEGTKYDEKLGSNESITQRAIQAGVPRDVATAAVTGGEVTAEQLRVKSLVPVPGLTGGPYLQYAYAIGALVGSKGFNGTPIEGTPAIFLNGSKYDFSDGKSFKSVDTFKNDITNAK